MSSLSTLPKGDSAWLLRKAIERIIQQVSVLETNIGSSTTGNSSNTQVIFNDNGTLRGDPDLIFNTSQNKLVATALESTTSLFVGTSATITGDLTVDTSTLKVDSANNRVGILTASPAQAVDVASGNLQVRTGGTVFSDTFSNYGAALQINAAGSLPLRLQIGGTTAYEITSANVHTWSNVGGVAGTAMTLNATGLGVGGSPAAKISCAGYSSANQLPDINIARSSSGTAIQTGPNIVFTDGTSNNTVTIQNSQGRFGIWNYGAGAWNERLSVDSSGNVGIGVTPSAWGAGLKALQVGATGYGALFDFNNDVIAMSANLLWTGSAYNRISASSKYALAYYQDIGGSHQWSMSSAAGTNAVAPTMNTLMTLNANGNLVLKGGTAAANGVGVTFPATQVASSDANTLDDYEEGTWTPVVADASTGGNVGTATINSATYTKIGRQVSIQCDLRSITTTGMTGANNLFIRGLPFASVKGGNGSFYTYRVGRNASTVSSAVTVEHGVSHAILSLFTASSANTNISILVSDIVSTTSELALSVTYTV